MDIIINAVALGIAPTIAFKQLFDHRRWIKIIRKSDRAAINEERPVWVIGNNPIILEAKCSRFAFADKLLEIGALRPRPSG